MDPDDEDLLVVGTVEDPDVASPRQPLGVAPQVVVIELLGGGDLEAVNRDALRVHAAHDVPNRAVLPGSVKRLDADEHAPRVLGSETGLVLGE